MILLAAIIILLIIDVCVFAYDKYIVSALLLLAQIAAAVYFIDGLHSYVVAEGWLTFALQAIPAYIGVGILVAAFKWLMFNFKVASKVKEHAVDFKQAHPDGQVKGTTNQYWAFLEHIDGSGGRGLNQLLKHSGVIMTKVADREQMENVLVPRAKKYVDRIASWIVQWPVVIIAFIFEDIFMKIGEWVSSLFGAIFTRFSKFLISRATKDIGV